MLDDRAAFIMRWSGDGTPCCRTDMLSGATEPSYRVNRIVISSRFESAASHPFMSTANVTAPFVEPKEAQSHNILCCIRLGCSSKLRKDT